MICRSWVVDGAVGALLLDDDDGDDNEQKDGGLSSRKAELGSHFLGG